MRNVDLTGKSENMVSVVRSMAISLPEGWYYLVSSQIDISGTQWVGTTTIDKERKDALGATWSLWF